MIASLKKYFYFIFFLLLLTSCTTTFMGSVLVITFSDIVFYVVLALLIAFFISIKRNGNRTSSFWIGFILSLLLTPLAGLIYLLILFSKNTNK